MYEIIDMNQFMSLFRYGTDVVLKASVLTRVQYSRNQNYEINSKHNICLVTVSLI